MKIKRGASSQKRYLLTYKNFIFLFLHLKCHSLAWKNKNENSCLKVLYLWSLGIVKKYVFKILLDLLGSNFVPGNDRFFSDTISTIFFISTLNCYSTKSSGARPMNWEDKNTNLRFNPLTTVAEALEFFLCNRFFVPQFTKVK